MDELQLRSFCGEPLSELGDAFCWAAQREVQARPFGCKAAVEVLQGLEVEPAVARSI